MLGINTVTLTGRIGNIPTIAYTPSGTPQVRVSLAVPKPPYKDKAGQKVQPDPNWIQVWIYGPAAESAAQWLVKGQQLGVIGSLQRRDFDGRDGARVNYFFVAANRVLFGDTPRGQAPTEPDAEQPVVGAESTVETEVSKGELPF